MSYLGNTGEINATFRRVDEVDAMNRRNGKTFFTAPGTVTNGRFGLFRWDMEPKAGGPGAHFHRNFSESFYILDGTVTLYNGENYLDATEGDFLYVPEGGVHGFGNNTGEPASMLILFAPGYPREKFFTEIQEIVQSDKTPTDEEWTEFFARHDQYMVPGR
jgi:mannose-6-phosphate isomerase-like protein (cupin superfamily)